MDDALNRSLTPAPRIAGLDSAVARLNLVVHELAANALRHGAGLARIELLRRADRWLIVVADRERSQPPIIAPMAWQTSGNRSARDIFGSRSGGLGLHLVAKLSHTWGWLIAGDEKLVWAEVTDVASPELLVQLGLDQPARAPEDIDP